MKEYEVSIPGLEGDDIAFTLKYPSLNAYSIAMTLEDTNPLKGKLILLKDMWVKGDERIINPDVSADNLKLFLRACIMIDHIVDLKLGEIKKK